jgi:hypothetical protein
MRPIIFPNNTGKNNIVRLAEKASHPPLSQASNGLQYGENIQADPNPQSRKDPPMGSKPSRNIRSPILKAIKHPPTEIKHATIPMITNVVNSQTPSTQSPRYPEGIEAIREEYRDRE